jgi:DNA-binding transcriptional LysR family regulator
VSTGDDTAAFIIAPKLAALNMSHPGISLEIVARFDVANLARREAEIGLRTVAPQNGDFVVRHAGWWNLGLYATRSYAQAHDLEPGLSGLSKAGIITWDTAHADLGGGPWFAKHTPGARVVMRANSRLIQLAACKAGLGVAILPSVAADHEPDLVQLLPPAEVVSTKLWLVVHRDLARTARIRAVLDFLGSIVPKE